MIEQREETGRYRGPGCRRSRDRAHLRPRGQGGVSTARAGAVHARRSRAGQSGQDEIHDGSGVAVRLGGQLCPLAGRAGIILITIAP